MKTIAILIFDDMEELDAIGPYEVFGLAQTQGLDDGIEVCSVYTVAETDTLVRCKHGLSLKPHYTLDNAPTPDIVIVPGGQGAQTQESNPKILNWLQNAAKTTEIMASVCTGLRITLKAGIASGKRVTTHHNAIEDIRQNYDAADVLDDVRFVKDGNYISATGISAGIDMALWLVGQISTPAHARKVRKRLQYDPAPPYMFEV